MYLARKYVQEDGAEFSGITTAFLDSLDNSVEKLVVPKRHTNKSLSGEEITPEFARDSLAGFVWSWDVFKMIVSNTSENKPFLFNFDETQAEVYEEINIDHLHRLKNSQLVSKISELIAQRDIFYQKKPRPTRGKQDDVHESFLKTYAINSNSSQSPLYDILYEEIREALANGALPKKVNSLVNKLKRDWEARHPGQQFYNPIVDSQTSIFV